MNTAPFDARTGRIRFRGIADALLTLAAAAGWYGAYSARTSLIRPVCQQVPSSCEPGLLNALDRSWLVNYHPQADYWSFGTQYMAGILAVLLALWAGLRSRSPGMLWLELWMLVQATALNGVINECLRLWIQRPRPFVYLDPLGQGGAAAHYTSFYSGHTSFAALAATCAVLIARRSGGAGMIRHAALGAGLLLVASTGALRVMAGRHFITDTLGGALFGVLIAVAVSRFHETRNGREA
jgi:membrane-associated phospholipid phosphatase